MRWLGKRRFRFLQGQRGFTLVEILVAVGILGLIGVVFMTSMNSAYRSVGMLDEQTQAEALARSQMEKIKEAVYQESEGGGWYLNERIVDLPPQYSISINVQTLDTLTCVEDGNCNTLQEITVTIFRTASEGDRPIFSVKNYKAKK